ncbi:energy-coupling factor transporter transmembrane component T family protein [Candidatus Latescibacterota bacterium]
MKFHPLTLILVSLELATLIIILPDVQGIFVIGSWLLLSLILPNRTETKLTPVFIKILFVAAVFLLLIHGVVWRDLSISAVGIMSALGSFTHIATPVVSIIFLSRNVRPAELYAFLIDLRIPTVIIFILFRTLWLVPRFIERIDEVITAQKLRGMRIDKTSERLRALIPTLGPIFSSMLEEISENSLTLTTRGFLDNSKKSHVISLGYSVKDFLIIVPVLLIFLVIML